VIGRVRRAGLLAVVGLVLLPVVAFAHPLGNFTINHYAGIRIEPNRILLDVVIDHAEIPAFQERQALDLDGDGEVSDPELERGRRDSCFDLGQQLSLSVAGSAVEPVLTVAGITLPPGAGGLPTLRIVCGFEAALGTPLADGTKIAFEDGSYPNRIGWREIVVEGSGVTVTGVDGELRTGSESARLTAYPQARLDAALLDKRIVVLATPGGTTLGAWTIADATPVGDEVGAPGAPEPSPLPAGGAVPGGVAGEIPALFQAADLTPLVLLASVLTAAALGAGHALTPGHGKTLMAAYLVGTRGTPVHAVGLGLSVSVSHTMGILLLALLVIGAQGVISPEIVVRWAPLAAAITIVAIGGWMLVSELRRRSAAAADPGGPDRDPGHDHDEAHDHPGDHEAPREHSHGGVPHSHLPAPGTTITWRSLFVLGLAGGIIPSTNALLILLGTIAAGRPGFGLVLVVAFGLGMALVMAGVGLVMIVARGRLDRLGVDSPLGRLRSWVPLGAAVVVLGLGLVLSAQSLMGPTVL
jgi:ABC-type nickel/cobalt efflux system permease component RcnA